MDCEIVREAASADLDGERTPIGAAELAAHLAGCAACRAWLEAAHQVTRRVRLGVADVVPDRTEELVAAVLADRAGGAARWMWPTRLGLVVVAAIQLALLVLTFGHYVEELHLTHELAAFDLALVVGFLTAAWRPAHAAGMVALVGVAAAGLLATAVLDVADGSSATLEEAPHLLAAVGWLLLFRLARAHRDGPYGPAARPAAERRRASGGMPSLWRRAHTITSNASGMSGPSTAEAQAPAPARTHRPVARHPAA